MKKKSNSLSYLDSREDDYLTTEQAASFLKISKASLLNMVNRGKIPYRKLGRLNRYLVEELRDLLNSNRRGPYEY